MIEYWTPEVEGTLNHKDINTVMGTLKILLNLYPNIRIEEIGDYYSQQISLFKGAQKSLIDYWGEEKGNELIKSSGIFDKDPTVDESVDGKIYSDTKVLGEYEINKRRILINHKYGIKAMTLKEFLEIRSWKNDYMTKVYMLGCNVLENVVIHEFGHALDYQYDINKDFDMIELYKSSTNRIREEVSNYACTNIHEFIAEGFLESTFSDARPLGVEIKALIDKVVKAGRARSEGQKVFERLLDKE